MSNLIEKTKLRPIEGVLYVDEVAHDEIGEPGYEPLTWYYNLNSDRDVPMLNKELERLMKKGNQLAVAIRDNHEKRSIRTGICDVTTPTIFGAIYKRVSR